jgi:uncharacterized membrane protein
LPHGHAHADVVSRRTRRALALVVATIAVATAAGMLVLWPGDVDTSGARALALISKVHPATVVTAEIRPCRGTAPSDDVDCRRVRARLRAGPDAGEIRTFDLSVGRPSPALHAGDEIVLSYQPNADDEFQYNYADRQRRTPLAILVVVFAAAVILLGRLRGLFALVGLAASIAVLLVFILPALLEGTSPVLVAIVGSTAIAYLALFLAHGFQTMTYVALLGTLVALALTIALASIFTELTQISGFASEDAVLVNLGRSGLDIQGLVLAGMVIGALGALDDMTVTQASAVAELRAANPTMTRRALTRAGLRIGRDHVASTVNTLALAYAGAALPLLILFVLASQSLGTVANTEIVATEIIRTLVGSIGLVAAVPVTTWLAARVAGPGRTRLTQPPEGDPREGDPREGDPREGERREDELPDIERDFWG